MKNILIFTILFALTTLNANNYRRVSVSENSQDALVQYSRGLHYKKSKNQRDAFKWMHKSALQGYRPAQYEFALMFHYGLGVKQNFDLARLWFRRAARKGEERAKIILYRFYAGKKIESKFNRPRHYYSKNFRTIR